MLPREAGHGVDAHHARLARRAARAARPAAGVLLDQPRDLDRRIGRPSRRASSGSAQAGAEVAGAGEAVLGARREAGQDDALELGVDAGIDVARPRHAALAHRAQRVEVGQVREQAVAGDQLAQQDADREHVAARVDVAVARLLRRDVRELAAHAAVAGRLLGALGDAEVGELDLAAARQQHVRRRHVAVDEAERLAVGAAGAGARARAPRRSRRRCGARGRAAGAGCASRATRTGDRGRVPSTNSMTRKYWPSSPRPTSKICTMLRWRSCESVLASVMRSSTKRLSWHRCGRIRLIATGFSKPPAATALPRKISAMPPTPMRSSSSYRAMARVAA